MPSRAYISFLLRRDKFIKEGKGSVNALSGLYLISTLNRIYYEDEFNLSVNALSGLYLISTVKLRQLQR